MISNPTWVLDSEVFAKDIWFTRRKKMKMSLRDAAVKMGINQATLSRTENGKRPDINTFFSICKVLGIVDFEKYFKKNEP